MRLKLRLLLIFTCILACMGCLFSACSIGQETGDVTLKKEGMTASVIYFGNGGTFNANPAFTVRQINYKPGTPVINIPDRNSGNSGASGGQFVEYVGYTFAGWYYAELDADGKPVYEDKEGGIVKVSSTPVSFPVTAQANTTLYFAAVWVVDARINIVLVSDSPVTFGGAQLSSGEVISQRNFGKFPSISIEDSSPRLSTTHTFLQYYLDEGCKTPYESTSVIEKNSDGTDSVLYAKYIEGQWTVVKRAVDVSNMLSSSSGNYYIFNDINCSGTAVGMGNNKQSSIVICGNGHTISDITISLTAQNDSSLSLFGILNAGASISDLTLKNVKVDVTVRTNNRVTAFALFTGVAEGVAIKNFTVENFALNFRLGDNSTINNISTGEGYSANFWLCGGYNSDAAFGVKFSGICVKNATLTITVGSGSNAKTYTYNSGLNNK